MRSFGLSATETGASYGAVFGVLAMVGILAGGFIGSWLSNRSPHYALRMLAIIFFVTLFSQRSEEHTSELQSLMRISYSVFCFNKKNIFITINISFLSLLFFY